MTKTTEPATVSPDTAPDTTPEEQPELLVTDEAPLEERLEVAVAILRHVLAELPAGHPDTAGALVHLDAVAERAASALPIPPADEV